MEDCKIFERTVKTTSSVDVKCDSTSTSLNADHFTFSHAKQNSQFSVVHDNPILRIKIVCITKFLTIFLCSVVVLISLECIFTKLFPHCTLHETHSKKKTYSIPIANELKFTHEELGNRYNEQI